MKKSFKELEEIDLKLELLSGSSIYAGNLEIIPYTLDEIREYGYSDYMTNLQWISVTVDDFISSIMDLEKRVTLQAERSNLKAFDFYMTLGGHELRENLMTALSMIFRTDDLQVLEDNYIAIDFMKQGILYEREDGSLAVDQKLFESIDHEDLRIVHRDNFDDIIEAIKLMNYLKKPAKKEADSDNPVDAETKALMEHMQKLKEKVENKKKKAKENEDGDIDIADIISAVSSKSPSLNKLNIWKLTIYQLYDEYSRLELIDNYDFSIRAMMAGAEKVELTHWSSKL
jgi:hypothetical protein